MVIAIILLTTIILVGCGQEAPTTEITNPIKTIEVETIETEDILVEDIETEEILYEETLYEENGVYSAKDLKHEMCDKNIYFIDNGDGVIKIWGKEEYYNSDVFMASVYYNTDSYEIEHIIIVHDYISKQVYDVLENYYTGEFWYEF